MCRVPPRDTRVMPANAPADLLDPPAALRRLRADEAPYPGTLHAGDPQTVHVDADLVPAALWRCALDGHILVPWDLSRTPGGHAAVMIHCPERLSAWSVAAGARAEYRPGEVVTVAVSVLRAAEEARRMGLEAGTWWVDATGRPVLAAAGEQPWADEAVDLLTDLAEGMRGAPSPYGGRRLGEELADALDDARRLVGSARLHTAEVVACEEALFAVAAPEPLALASSSAELESTLPRRATSLRRASEPAVAESWLARFTDGEWAGRVAEAVRSVVALPGVLGERRRERAVRRAAAAAGSPTRRGSTRARGRGDRESGAASARGAAPARSPRDGRGGAAGGQEPEVRGRRRAPLLIAAAVGGAVLLGGLLWPEPDSRAAEAVAPSPAATVSADGAATPDTDAAPAEAVTEATTAPSDGAAAPDAQAAPSADGDLEAAARQIVRALSACAGGTTDAGVACAALREDPAAAPPAGLVATAPDAQITLVDEYGGVAVFRVEPAEGTGNRADGPAAQILVLVSVDGKWLVRDVYDVADQP